MLELASRTLARPSRATLPGSQAPRPWPALADERTKNGSTPEPPPSLFTLPHVGGEGEERDPGAV